ncbi:MAG: hypothetical protein WAU07_02880 [Microgenomates group bacterium]
MEKQMRGKTTIANEFSKLKQNQKLLAILILFFVCTIAWTAASLFSSQTSSSISPKLLEISKPLNPVLNVDALSRIEAKKLYTDEELADFPIYKIVITESGRGERIVNINTTAEDLLNLENTESSSPQQTLQTDTSDQDSLTTNQTSASDTETIENVQVSPSPSPTSNSSQTPPTGATELGAD